MTAATKPQSMSERERALLIDAVGDDPVRLSLRTLTRVDTGRWLGRSRVWLCITDRAVVLLAVSKRSYLEQATLADCSKSTYCHTAGSLLLAPAEHLRFRSLRMPPADALRVLECLRADDRSTEPTPSPEPEPSRA